MTAFIRRFRETPTVEVLTSIEQIALVDETPTTPVTGVGTGVLMVVGEFEDGPFNTPTQVFGETDEAAKFGGFGFTYGQLLYQNPCARIHLGETWNGNAFIKGKFLKPPQKIVVRVDTRVGDVQLRPLAALRTAVGPFRLAVGQQLTVAPDGGAGVTTTAVAAAVATRTGIAFPGGGNLSLYVGGEQIGITIDANPEVIVTFQAADQTAAQVAARINSFLGYSAATTILAGTGIQIVGLVQGTSGKVTLRNVSGTPLTNIGLTANTVNGTGNVADLSAVTATEVAALINALAGIDSIVDAQGRAVVYSPTVGAAGSVNVTAGAMATALGLTTGTTVTALVGVAARIPAGTRVRTAGGAEWVLMQTTNLPAGTSTAPNVSSFSVPVRPGLDDGTAVTANAGTVVVLADVPTDRMFSVTNASNLSAALSEDTIDVRYDTAWQSTIDPSGITRVVNNTLSARRSPNCDRSGQNNAVDASAEGNFGRHFHLRAPFQQQLSDAITNVGTHRIDRVFFCYPGFRVRIPEIATVGATGGTGFTADGVITVGSDGPLAYINSVLPPEQNPGQATGLLEAFVTGIESIIIPSTGLAQVFNRQVYETFKASGICAPRIDQLGQVVFQSEVTAELTPGRTTQKRRKFADYSQDSVSLMLLPESKRLATDAREAGIDAKLVNFFTTLLSPDNPDLQRIAAFQVRNTNRQNPDLYRRGISSRKVAVQMLNSLDTFLINFNIGEGVVVASED